jgi:hypothetical protein
MAHLPLDVRCESVTRDSAPDRGWRAAGIRRVALIAGLCLVWAASPVSAGTKFESYPDRKASECAAKAEKDGLVVGAQPMDDTRDQKTYFGTNMTEKGYLPVYLVVENQSSADSYLFDKSNVALAGASADAVKEARSKRGETLAMIGVGGIFAMHAITKGTEVQENLLKREIQSKTLSPRLSVNGFLYVPIPREGARGGISLQIPLVNARTNEVRVINITI